MVGIHLSAWACELKNAGQNLFFQSSLQNRRQQQSVLDVHLVKYG